MQPDTFLPASGCTKFLQSIDFTDCTLLTGIPQNAFCQNSNLSSANFTGYSKMKLIGIGAFKFCNNLTFCDFINCISLETLVWVEFHSPGSNTNKFSVNFSGCNSIH